MSILQDKHKCTPFEYILKFSLIYLGQKKTTNDEIIDKIKANEDNDSVMKKFLGDGEHDMFIFAMPGNGGMINF
jgi:hypothetical protein